MYSRREKYICKEYLSLICLDFKNWGWFKKKSKMMNQITR